MKSRYNVWVLSLVFLSGLVLASQTYNSTTGRFSGSGSGIPQKGLVTGSAYTNATTTFSSITGLSFAVSASTNYAVTCQLVYQGTATTAGPKFQWTGPASPTAVLIGVNGDTGPTALADAAATAFSTALTTLGTLADTGVNHTGIITLGLVNGVNAGTVQLQAAANGSGTVTIAVGSYCTMQ